MLISDKIKLISANQFDFIGKLENFNADFQHILARIKTAGRHCEAKTAESNRTWANKRLKQYYNYATVEMVGRLFEEDFRIFGYSTEPDFL